VNRLNHVKLVTPEPDAVVRFLTEVAGLPQGFEVPSEHIGPAAEWRPEPEEQSKLTMDDIISMRGANGKSGFIVGDGTSRQLQIMSGDHAAVWAVTVGTTDVDAAYERCQAKGYVCTPRNMVPFVGGDKIHYFFARVGGLVFEIMNIEAAQAE